MHKDFNSVFNLKNKDTRICMIILVFIFVSIIIAKVNGRENTSGSRKISAGNIIVKADSLVEFARSLIGIKYCYGSCKPLAGLDCSGFVHYVFAQSGIMLPRSSCLMAESGEEIELNDCRKGDLIFFTGTDLSSKKVGHVGIIITDKGQPVEFIHSSSGTKNNGVVITPMSSVHYQKRFLKVKRVLF
jgi:cell wall-associated NlpC family hydrolase